MFAHLKTNFKKDNQVFFVRVLAIILIVQNNTPSVKTKGILSNNHFLFQINLVNLLYNLPDYSFFIYLIVFLLINKITKSKKDN